MLKFATAPFRAGRSLDGAIDELVEQMKAKGDQPQGEGPRRKIQLQIEQMKQQTAREKLKQDDKQHAAELEQKDKHKTWELNNAKEIERIKLGAKAQDDQAKMRRPNAEGEESREAHQAHMLENQQKMALDRQKFDMQVGAHQMKQADNVARSNERQMAHQQKMSQPQARPI